MKLTIRKTEGFSSRNPIKVYDLEWGGVSVGTLQTWGREWDVFDASFTKRSSHTTIKAAVRVAGKVL